MPNIHVAFFTHFLVHLSFNVFNSSKDVIRKRFATYREESMPIIEMYLKEGKVRKIIADKSIEDVYKEVESLLKE
jgi:UMP-CMP kinase